MFFLDEFCLKYMTSQYLRQSKPLGMFEKREVGKLKQRCGKLNGKILADLLPSVTTTLPETNSEFTPENQGGWNMNFPFGIRPVLRGEHVSFRECKLAVFWSFSWSQLNPEGSLEATGP